MLVRRISEEMQKDEALMSALRRVGALPGKTVTVVATADGVLVGSGGETAEIVPEAADHIFAAQVTGKVAAGLLGGLGLRPARSTGPQACSSLGAPPRPSPGGADVPGSTGGAPEHRGSTCRPDRGPSRADPRPPTSPAPTYSRWTKMWSAASGSISAVSPPEPTSTPSAVRDDA